MTTRTWDTPRQIMEPTLFPEPTAKALAWLRVSIDDCSRWRDRGWLTFDPDVAATLDAPRLNELEFVRDIARFGLTDAQVDELVKGLAKPYAYDPRVVAYSFALGWVQCPRYEEPPPPDEVIEEHLGDWFDELAEAGDVERLQEVISMARAALARCESKRGSENRR